MEKEQFYLDEYRFDLSKPLDDSYRLVNVLGSGSYGVVLHIQNRRTNHDLALKLVLQYNDIYLDVEKKVASKSDFFVRCYGLFICDKLPESWIRIIEKTKNEYTTYLGERYYGFFYEYVEGITLQKWIREKSSEEDSAILLGIVFEIFHALKQACLEFKFIHGDFESHLNNIMVKPVQNNTRQYKYGDEIFIINTGFTVKFIDFDRSRFSTKSTNLLLYSEVKYDLYAIMDNFEHLRVDEAIRSSFSQMIESDLSPDYLLSMPELERFKAVSSAKESTTKKHKQTINCHICGNASTRALKNRPSLTFCNNNDCVLKLGELILMI